MRDRWIDGAEVFSPGRDLEQAGASDRAARKDATCADREGAAVGDGPLAGVTSAGRVTTGQRQGPGIDVHHAAGDVVEGSGDIRRVGGGVLGEGSRVGELSEGGTAGRDRITA